jgi:hypothetical protein
MKVPTKVLYASYLPKVKDRNKLLMADNGMSMIGGPKPKNLLSSIPTSYLDNLDNLGSDNNIPKFSPINTQVDTSNYQAPDTDKAIGNQPINPYTGQPVTRYPPKPTTDRRGFNVGEAFVAAGSLFDSLIPNDPITRWPRVEPQEAYNPHPYGTGSQALMEYGGPLEAKDGHWIQHAVNPKHKGYCTPMTKKTCTPRRKALAKRFKHGLEDGGFIESIFTQSEMAQGGGLSREQDYGSKSKPYPSVSSNEFAGPHRSYPIPTRADAIDALRLAHLHGNSSVIAKVHSKYPELKEYGGEVGNEAFYNGDDGFAYSGIHINPANKGKFNALKKRTGKSTEELTHSKNPLTRKRAIFAQNAKKWKHAEGGLLPFTQDYATQEQVDYGGNTIDTIFAHGGLLTADKAKEILRDGTAQGHKLTPKQKRYFGYIAGGGTPKAPDGVTIPGAKPSSVGNAPNPDDYYTNNATLQYYKEQLNNKLKAKNPDAYNNYLKGLVDARKNTDPTAVQKYNDTSDYNDYLTPQEVKDTLGDNYNSYIQSLQNVNRYNIAQGRRPLYGEIEGEKDVNNLNYGRRFASLSTTPTYSIGDMSKGTGYQRMYKYNPSTKKVDISETGNLQYRPKPFNPSQVENVATLNSGGKMMDSNVYDNGGIVENPNISTHYGGTANVMSYNPYDGGTTHFNGPSHADGGIGMGYNGKQVEVEGGETAAKDSNGDLNIFGNMYIPGTKTKFKTVSKEIADKENKFDRLKTTGTNTVNSLDPRNKYEQLKFNSAELMMKGGDLGQQELAKQKQKLADLQNAMLDTAKEFNLDPQGMSQGNIKKAKKGMYIRKAAAGDNIGPGDPNDPTRADRNKNPGNIKYGKFAKAHGAIGQDKDGFAIFPDRNTGSTAMKTLLTSNSYKNKPIDEAIKTWTGSSPYRYNLPDDLKGKKVSDLSNDQVNTLMGIMTKGEGTRYGTPQKAIPTTAVARPTPVQPFTPYGLPSIPPLTVNPPQAAPNNPAPPPLSEINIPERNPIPTNARGLGFQEVAGELYGLATNQERPVYAQRYNPQLYEPYQVSFQDRINQNQESFNDIKRLVGNNPSALGSLAAQKYSADNAVRADEFRTNQGISNQITNQNISLMNDAQLKNLGIADTQATKQEGANAKTREVNQMIINSLSSKYAQNQLENRRLKAYENLYNYRFTPNAMGGDDATNFNPDQVFDFTGPGGTTNPGGRNDIRTITNYDKNGNVRNYRQVDDSQLNDEYRALKTEMARRKLPLLSVPKLFHGGYIK